MSYRLIALDLDGTLLDSSRCIRPATLSAIERTLARGVQVVLVTGRHHGTAYPYYHQLKLETPVICCNGAYVFDYCQSKVLTGNPLEKQQALKLLVLAEGNGVDCVAYMEKAMVFEQENEFVTGMMAWSKTLLAAVRPDIHWVPSLQACIEEEQIIWKLVMHHTSLAVLNSCLAQMQREFPLNYEWTWRDRFDIGQAGKNKGDRLADFARSQGIDLAEVMAFGDNHNDVSMLTRAGLGVAMGNSEEPVKACADWITGSNDEDGVAEALQRFLPLF